MSNGSSSNSTNAVVIQALAGGIGGTVALWITYPLYVVTLKLQAEHNKRSKARGDGDDDDEREDDDDDSSNTCTASPTAVATKQTLPVLSQNSLISILKEIVDTEGVGALYKGCAAGLFAVSVQSAVFYAFYRVFDSSEGAQSALRSLGAAFASRGAAGNPAEGIAKGSWSRSRSGEVQHNLSYVSSPRRRARPRDRASPQAAFPAGPL